MIAIINYGLGNINAFANVYKRLNIPIKIVTRNEELTHATKIIIPGVGAFDHAITLLQQSGMRSLLDELVLQKKVPVLGICVGMQILANSSEEGVLSGLGWIDGKIMKLDSSKHKLQLPHMGWNTITPTSSNKLLDTFDKSTRFYFLHSYYFKCNNADDELGKTEYGISFSSAVNSGNIYGVQFHPEKSHENGIKVLKNFANL